MPLVSTLVGITMAFLACLAAPPVNAAPLSGNVEIRVEAGAWGNARPKDIETVLAMVANTLVSSFPQHAGERIAVAYSAAGPSVLVERSAEGARRVFLKVQDTRWDQFAYQFSHELCHIFTNHEHRETAPGTVVRDHQWFEETLCEAVSLFTLERMAIRWEQSPPYPGWKTYAPAFREYAQELLGEQHRQLPANETFGKWFSANLEALESNPYLREKNELLAVPLLSLFQNVPGSLEAIGYLNAEPAVLSRTFTDYLTSWHNCCPRENRAIILEVMALFNGERDQRTSLPPT